MLIHLDGLALAEEGHDDGESDRHLGRRNRDDEENEDVAVHRVVVTGERHQGQG